MAQPVLGILTLYLNNNRLLEEKPVYQKMITAGKRMGLDIFVFTPQDVNYNTNRIHAMFYDPVTKQWTRRWCRFPHMIYDRCRIQRSHRFEQLKKFRVRYQHMKFLNRPMRNKWTVYRTLISDNRFRPHLPHTRIVEGSRDISEMLERYPLLYLKPINGTGGRGILRIEKQRGRTWLIQGRDLSRKIIRPERVSSSAILRKVAAWYSEDRRYLIQQGIQLKLPSGRVHDYRMLAQKNGSGRWEITGCAGRVGPPGSITSNLHGGGKAAPMHELLMNWIGSETKVDQIKLEAARLGVEISEYLDLSYGHLCELALDLAIDQTGHIWLLEVNPKPAREVFARAGEHETYRNAIIRPLEYALWLYNQKSRVKEPNKSSKHA
ncbi:YheC/YheD family protein [Paenibacillus tarimensis]